MWSRAKIAKIGSDGDEARADDLLVERFFEEDGWRSIEHAANPAGPATANRHFAERTPLG